MGVVNDSVNNAEQEWVRTEIERLVEALKGMLFRKNTDYGMSAFKNPPLAPDLPPEAAILVRIGDKIGRLQTIAKNKTLKETGERYEDTMWDLAGYIILYFAAINNPYHN